MSVFFGGLGIVADCGLLRIADCDGLRIAADCLFLRIAGLQIGDMGAQEFVSHQNLGFSGKNDHS